MVEEVNGGDNSTDSKKVDLDRRAIHIHGGMEHNLAKYAKYYSRGNTKNQEVVNLQEKLITIKEIFLDISKQMLKISYTSSLGHLLKITPKLKRYIWHKLIPKECKM
jgi:hypothetical protein